MTMSNNNPSNREIYERLAGLEARVKNVEKFVSNHLPTELKEIRLDIKENRGRQFQLLIGMVILFIGIIGNLVVALVK